jgi:hypothetical protein
MDGSGRVVALVHDHEEAVAAREDLARGGIAADVVHPEPGTYVIQDESFGQHVRAARRGGVIGLALGALVGLVLALAVPAVRELGWTVQLVLVYGVALQATMPAVMWGMGRVAHYDDDPLESFEVQPSDDVVLVHAARFEPRSRRVIERHAGEVVPGVGSLVRLGA